MHNHQPPAQPRPFKNDFLSLIPEWGEPWGLRKEIRGAVRSGGPERGGPSCPILEKVLTVILFSKHHITARHVA